MSDKRLTLKKRLHIIKHSLRGKKMAPAFSAFHTFLFTPDETTQSGSHIRVADDLKRTMNTVIMALIPVLLFSAILTAYAAQQLYLSYRRANDPEQFRY